MEEEILSPTSPPYSYKSPLQYQRKGGQGASGHSNTILGDQTFQAETSLRDDDAPKQDRQATSRLPGLNVVTNFPRTLGSSKRAADGSRKQNQSLALRRQETQESTDKTENLGLSHELSSRSLKSSASKGRLDELKRAASKASTLSPSDRAVMIGISIPPEDFADHDINADATGTEPESLGSGSYAISRQPSDAPSIVVTPARNKAPRSDDLDEPVQPPRRRVRAASSVYSQAQQNGVQVVDSSIVPPVPPLPLDAQRHNAEFYPSNGKQPPTISSRIVSTSTFFDEEENLDSEKRPGTGESQLRILTKQNSFDSIASRHRSKGWWDHIVTPFLPRSPMNFKGSSPTMPNLPNVRHIPEVRPNRDRVTSHYVSLEPAQDEGLRSGLTSWTDMSIDLESEKRALGLDGQPHREPHVSELPRELRETGTPTSPVRHEGFGAASEYYEACLYDMHSPEPYFECQNHTCLPSRVGISRVVEGQKNTSAVAKVEDVIPRELQERQNTEPMQMLAAQQAPSNRFSSAFREAIAPDSRPKTRPLSEETLIEDLDTTPAVEEAHAAPVVRAPEPVAAQPLLPNNGRQHPRETEGPQPPIPSESPESTPQHPPAYSPPRQERPPRRYVAVMPPGHQPNTFEQIVSPVTPTPGPQRQMPRDTPPFAKTSRADTEYRFAGRNNTRNHYYENPEANRPGTTLADLYPPPRDAGMSQKGCNFREKDTPKPREHNSKVLAGFDRCLGRKKKPMSKRKKWMLIALAIVLLLMVILIMVLAMTLTRKGGPRRTVSIQTAWLNMTGYPPIPTGISTIVQPKPVLEVSGCIVPSTMWSCDLPKEEQQSLSTGAADQPNFRVEIVFQNETSGVAANASSVSRRSDQGTYERSYGRMVNPVSAGNFIRDRLRRARSTLSESLDSPSPSPPGPEDQMFLGKTTDNNTLPFNGEYTPFSISFLSSAKLSPDLSKRETSSSTDNTTDSFPDLENSIPAPDTYPNGTAAAAIFLPYPAAQPLRLYNRGQSSEHYGFYTYFSKSIFLKSTAPIDGISNNTDSALNDNDGGVTEDAASVRCTWAQTRFLVQIWTRKGFVASSQVLDANSTASDDSTNTTASSANNFQAPGSFPYPVTVTVDRHGGDINTKLLYCYGIDDEEKPISSQKKIQLEDRSFGGTLVNPTLGPFGQVNVTLAEGGPGGIDGGSGGCGCQWKNFGWQ